MSRATHEFPDLVALYKGWSSLPADCNDTEVEVTAILEQGETGFWKIYAGTLSAHSLFYFAAVSQNIKLVKHLHNDQQKTCNTLKLLTDNEKKNIVNHFLNPGLLKSPDTPDSDFLIMHHGVRPDIETIQSILPLLLDHGAEINIKQVTDAIKTELTESEDENKDLKIYCVEQVLGILKTHRQHLDTDKQKQLCKILGLALHDELGKLIEACKNFSYTYKEAARSSGNWISGLWGQNTNTVSSWTQKTEHFFDTVPKELREKYGIPQPHGSNQNAVNINISNH